jgi:hypothetical protein
LNRKKWPESNHQMVAINWSEKNFKWIWIFSTFLCTNIFFKYCLYFYFTYNTHTLHIKSITHNSKAMFSLKTFHLDGIRTWLFCLCGIVVFFFWLKSYHCTTRRDSISRPIISPGGDDATAPRRQGTYNYWLVTLNISFIWFYFIFYLFRIHQNINLLRIFHSSFALA